MKKLYISFILLFGFLIFVPQIALGDLIRPGTKWYKYKQAQQKKREKNKVSL